VASCAKAKADRLFCLGFKADVAGTGGDNANRSYASDVSKVYESASQGAALFGHYGYENFGSVHCHQLGPVLVARATDIVTAVLSGRVGSTSDSATTLRAFDAFGAIRNGDLTNQPASSTYRP